MKDQEGVIQYNLDQKIREIPLEVTELSAWRTLLYKLELINQRSDKYNGLSYGNLSVRHPIYQEQFIISASQTGHLADTTQNDYTLVTEYNIQENRMHSIGLKPPSSEALTHAAIYQADPSIQAVVHVHSPLIWQYTHQLGLACTEKQMTYGSVAMANAVCKLTKTNQNESIFCMLGHEDGVVVYGQTLAESCLLLFATLAKATYLHYQSQLTE